MFTKMKILIAILVTFALAIPLSTFAAEVSGVIQGLDCVTSNMKCPTDKLDPHLATESNFVLLTSGGYYFLSNLDRIILGKYATMQAKAVGEVNDKYRAIKVKSFSVMMDGKYKEVWTQADAEAAYRKMIAP